MMATPNQYKTQLHKIIVHSADVLPEQVKFYLKDLAKSRSYDMKRKIVSEIQFFKPLIHSVPKEFVDFAIDLLVKKAINPKNLPDNHRKRSILSSDDDLHQDYGISNDLSFHPPAPIQGPFLYLLRSHEHEGLRLIHSLANMATDKWCEYQKREEFDSCGLTPLPIQVNFSSGSQQFWGDTQVYCWFRGTTVGPYSVMSALMALEQWMEQQIESGRDVQDLFDKVLEESHCVSVLGICISIAIAYPGKCLKAALPIVSSPYIWEMDISRLKHDSNNSLWKILKEGDQYNKKLYYDFIERRNKRPQRSHEIRYLAMNYVLSDDDSLRNLFECAVEKFTENLPFWYEEETKDLNKTATLLNKVRSYQVFGKRENYRQQQVNGYSQIWVEYPKELEDQNEEIVVSDLSREYWFRVSMWAKQIIENASPYRGITLAEAVEAAKSFQTPEDFVSANGENLHNIVRLQAIAGVAAAILIKDFEWAQENNHVEWSRMVLLAASDMIKGEQFSALSLSVNFCAACGLATLATHGMADFEVRQKILLLIGKSSKRFYYSDDGVLKALFFRLQTTWATDLVLCWNALSLCLSLSVIPEQIFHKTHIREHENSCANLRDWRENIVRSHLEHLSTNKILDLPRIPTERSIIFVREQAQRGLYALPLTEMCQDVSITYKLLQLCDDLIARTIIDNTLKDENNYHNQVSLNEWNYFVFGWLACLTKSLSLEEVRHHILKPVRDYWTKAPSLTINLLHGYIRYQIAYLEGPSEQALEIWKEVCTWVLDSPEISRRANHDYLDSDIGEVLQLIIFTYRGSSYIKDDWEHAHLFVDIFDQWIGVVGHNPYAYSHLLTMLNSIGWQFSPETTIKWLSLCSQNATHDLWKEKIGNAKRTAELLNRIWVSFEAQIKKNTKILKLYSDLVYCLVSTGVPLSGILQSKLESRE